MFRTNDPIADAMRRDAEEQSFLDKLPKCEYCGHTIMDDYLYDLAGDIMCESCLKEHFRKPVEDYME